MVACTGVGDGIRVGRGRTWQRVDFGNNGGVFTGRGAMKKLHLIPLGVCLSLVGALVAQTAAAEPPARTRPLKLTYLGVAGWVIEGDKRVVIVDPYLSRPDLKGPVTSDRAAVAAHTPKRADLILVGHSHVDHLLDAPAVALRTGARLVGSDTTVKVAAAHGVPSERTVRIRGRERLTLGGMPLRVIPSLHSLVDGLSPDRRLPDPLTLPMKMDDFVEGGTFAYGLQLAGHRIYVMDTANFIEAELKGVVADIAVVATALRERVPDYTCRLLHALGDPSTVLVTHFDDWQAPPSAGPVPDDVERFVDEVGACLPETRVIVPQPFRPIAL